MESSRGRIFFLREEKDGKENIYIKKPESLASSEFKQIVCNEDFHKKIFDMESIDYEKIEVSLIKELEDDNEISSSLICCPKK